MNRQVKFFLLILAIVVFVSMIAFPAFSRGNSRWDHAAFVTHQEKLKFFDHNTGKVYVYSEQEGRISKICLLEELGKDLKKVYQIRNFSVVD